jgi:hypothetical protein
MRSGQKRGGDEGWERGKGGVWDRMQNETEKSGRGRTEVWTM